MSASKSLSVLQNYFAPGGATDGLLQSLARRKRSASAPRDLVMGMAVGYRPEMAWPFVESLFSAGAFSGDVVIFARARDLALRSYLKSRGVKVVTFRPKAYPVRNLVMARHFAYLKFLKTAAAKHVPYRNILLTDVRDVIFQKPLFAEPCNELEFHYEADLPRIGDCRWNARWIRNAFGEATLARMADKRISCSGTVCGRLSGILLYLEQMEQLILGLPERPKSAAGGDQGVHNYILHSGLLGNVSIMDNFQRVATLHHVNGAELRTDQNGCVVNPDGGISEIAHQWDRHRHLEEAIVAHAIERRQRRHRPVVGTASYA